MLDIKTQNENSIEWILEPMTFDYFVSNFWEKKQLIINRGAPNYWQSILTFGAIDKVLSSSNFYFPSIRLANSREKVEREMYVNEENLINISKVFKLYREGSTIILNQLHEYIPSLTRLCRLMEKIFNFPFQTNIYLTPSNSQGFDAHYDTHDVFILQIYGSKKWRLFNKPINSPLYNQDFRSSDYKVGNVTQEFELHPGDLAYIPSGLIHDATANSNESLHITLGALYYRWVDLIKNAIEKMCLNDPAFRKALPIDINQISKSSSNYYYIFCNLIEKLKSEFLYESSVNNMSDNFIATRKPILDDYISQLRLIKKMPLETYLQVRPNSFYKMNRSSNSIVLQCYDNNIHFPLEAFETLSFVLRDAPFLVKQIPGKIDFQLKLLIIKKLIQERLLMFLVEK